MRKKVLPVTHEKLSEVLGGMSLNGLVHEDSFICYVDDGSSDSTWDLIRYLHKNTIKIKSIKLSRNCGHQNALPAGLLTAKDKCYVTISIDANLQDDISVIESTANGRYRTAGRIHRENVP